MSVLEEIVKALAEAEGVDAQELDIRLYDYIDTDAVRSLVAHENESVSLQFETPNHTIRVTGGDEVIVDESEKPMPA